MVRRTRFPHGACRWAAVVRWDAASDDRHATFARRNTRQLDTAINQATHQLLDIADNPAKLVGRSRSDCAGPATSRPPRPAWAQLTIP